MSQIQSGWGNMVTKTAGGRKRKVNFNASMARPRGLSRILPNYEFQFVFRVVISQKLG